MQNPNRCIEKSNKTYTKNLSQKNKRKDKISKDSVDTIHLKQSYYKDLSPIVENVNSIPNTNQILIKLSDNSDQSRNNIINNSQAGKIKNYNIIQDENIIDREVKNKINGSKLVKIIRDILSTDEKPPKKSIFKFNNTEEAAIYNSKVLSACDYDYEKVLSKQRGTTIFYGSEFRSISNLRKLLEFHKDWPRIEKFLSEGTDTSFKHISDKSLKNDCVKNMERGNHKSSFKSDKVAQFLNKTYSKEVR